MSLEDKFRSMGMGPEDAFEAVHSGKITRVLWKNPEIKQKVKRDMLQDFIDDLLNSRDRVIQDSLDTIEYSSGDSPEAAAAEKVLVDWVLAHLIDVTAEAAESPSADNRLLE